MIASHHCLYQRSSFAWSRKSFRLALVTGQNPFHGTKANAKVASDVFLFAVAVVVQVNNMLFGLVGNVLLLVGMGHDY
jgi:hypothetical protein